MKKLGRFGFVALAAVVLAVMAGLISSAGSIRPAAAFENDRAVSSSSAQPALDSEAVRRKLAETSIYFEQNLGQQDKRVKYLTRGGGTEMFLTATEAVYVIRSRQAEGGTSVKEPRPLHAEQRPDATERAVALYMKLVGANKNADFLPSQQLEHRTNYLKGRESDWRAQIPNYARVTAENIYDGVSIVWQGRERGGVQYDFEIAPGADANKIEWAIEGADHVSVDSDGSLVIETEAGVMRQSRPVSFQEAEGVRSEVTSGFVASQQVSETDGSKTWHVKFAVGEYDRTRPLTIDPTMNLAGSTFLGGATRDESRAIAIDGTGNIYVTGFENSTAFPTTPGSLDTTQNGALDAFVTKLNPDASSLIYSTFVGGNSDDLGYSIVVDPSGNVYMTGYTGGGTFPTTAGAYDQTFNGTFDAFVTKLNATGSSLIYSTFIGGNAQDTAKGLAIDPAGNVFITGVTDGGTPAYPTTAGAFDQTFNGAFDVFVTKLNAGGSSLGYSTFIGGNSLDAGEGIVIDSSGNAFVTGYAFDATPAFPTTAGAYDTSHNGTVDVIVTKLNAAGSTLVYSTFIGGDNDDVGFGIGIDASGSAYVTGRTTNGTLDYPATPGAFDTTHNGNLDIFVTKVDSAGLSLAYSTLVGGFDDDFANGIFVDVAGNAIVTGRTDGNGYPAVAGSFDTTHNGLDDVFVTKVNAVGSGLVSSTFLGGTSDDVGFAVTADRLGNTLVTGWTAGGTPAYPTTATALDTTHNGDNDVFVTKLSGGSTPFDFDGDRKTDVAIFRPGPPTGAEWWINRSTNGSTFATQFGASSDVIAPADFTGDGKTDVTFFRPSTGSWFVLRSEDLTFFSFPFGANGDVPVPADYDADGKADPAVFRAASATWFINKSTGGTDIVGFGAPGDKPVIADYDGDSKADISIFRPNGPDGEWWVRRSSTGVVFATVFGLSTDKTVQGDYTGDGKIDIAIWRPSNGNWFILRSEDLSFFAFPFGANGDVPVPGDYDGDGKNDAAVFRPASATWFANKSTGGTLIQQFGSAGDVPLPSAYVR